MSGTTNDEHAPRRRQSQSLATPYLEFDLVREIEHLHGEPEWKTGRNARTIVKYDNLRVVLTALKAHVRISEHRTEGRISIQTIRGQILVRAEWTDIRSAGWNPARVGPGTATRSRGSRGQCVSPDDCLARES